MAPKSQALTSASFPAGGRSRAGAGVWTDESKQDPQQCGGMKAKSAPSGLGGPLRPPRPLAGRGQRAAVLQGLVQAG